MRFLLGLSLLAISFLSQAQFSKSSQAFVSHLLSNKMYDEALLVLHEKLGDSRTQQQKDSINLSIGKIHYSLQQLPQSIQFLDAVSSESEFVYEEAKLFSAFNEVYLNRFDQGIKKLKALNGSKQYVQQLANFEMSGVFLLTNRLSSYDSISTLLNPEWNIIQQQHSNFRNYRSALSSEKQKSPFTGGVLSALIPGAGKVYAGRKANGIYTFLITSIMAAQTVEAYRKDGPRSARFIIYGSLLSSFYIGNIWGSALAVKVVRNERRDAIKNQILFDMHIPLRTFFQ